MRRSPDQDLRARVAAARIAVLGQVALVDGEATHRLTGRPARLLVALVAASRPRTVDELSEVVWGGELPPTHRAALHVHLGTLRQLFARCGEGCRIVRDGDGYALALDGWEIDAWLAIDLLAAARGCLDTDPAAALELTGLLSGLYRGVPFAVAGETVDVAASHQLEGVRREGEEIHVEALLRMGRGELAEPAAWQAVREEPLREMRWGQLLRARYLSGGLPDALRTFQEARTVLVDALGVEPGPALRGLEAAALVHDIDGLRLPGGPVEAMGALPVVHGPLIGREAEVERILTSLAEGRSVMVLGPPGVGKSRVAVAVASAGAYGQVAWSDLRRDADAAPESMRNVVEWARRQPEGLVVLDNADGALPAAVTTFEELQRVAPRVRVVVTSRVRIEGAASVELLGPLDVPPIEADDDEIEQTSGVRLLREAIGALAPTAVLTAADAGSIVRSAGGLPLVLRLRAAAARALPAIALREQSASVEGDEIDVATHVILSALDETAARAFIDLTSMLAGFDADLGARVTGLDPEQFDDKIAELVDHGLVQARPNQPAPYSFLEPIRLAGLRLLERGGRVHEVRSRHAEACLARARALSASPASETVRLAALLAADLPQHRRALEHLRMSGDADRALELACRLEVPLYRLGWWSEKVELLDTALGIPGPPSRMRARAHALRARPGPMHLFDLEHAERAEEMAHALEDERLASFARHLRSIGLWWHGDAARSVNLARGAVEALEDAGQMLVANEARKFLGVALIFDGEPDEGLAVQREVLAAVRAIGEPFTIAHNLAYLGHCHRLLGDDAAALADWTEARELCRQVGNRGTAIHVNIGLADLAVDRGDLTVALDRTGEALDLTRASKASVYEAWAWTVAMRAHELGGSKEAMSGCAWRAIHAQGDGPTGEIVRLAIELAHIAVGRGDLIAAARLLGVIDATPDRRELPFPSPAERERHARARGAVSDQLGPCAREHIERGARCTVAEAAASLLVM